MVLGDFVFEVIVIFFGEILNNFIVLCVKSGYNLYDRLLIVFVDWVVDQVCIVGFEYLCISGSFVDNDIVVIVVV